MPNSAEHQAKYRANRQFLDNGNGGTPLSTADSGWAATVAFYAALHLIDRLASRISYHPASHADRLRFVATRHRPIYTAFNSLKTASESARYGTIRQFAKGYPGTTVQAVPIDQRLAAIETYVNSVFSPPPPPSPPPAP